MSAVLICSLSSNRDKQIFLHPVPVRQLIFVSPDAKVRSAVANAATFFIARMAAERASDYFP